MIFIQKKVPPKQFVIYINGFAWSLDLNLQNAKQIYFEIP